jgi:hypothetical protein
MRQTIWVAAGLALSVLAGGCNNSEQKLQQAEKSADSWDATLALVRRQWAADRIPPKYVRQLGEAAANSLEDTRQSVNGIEKGDKSRRDQLTRRIIELRDRAEELRDAAASGRRAS